MKFSFQQFLLLENSTDTPLVRLKLKVIKNFGQLFRTYSTQLQPNMQKSQAANDICILYTAY